MERVGDYSNTAARRSRSAIQLNAWRSEITGKARVVAASPRAHPLTAQRAFLEREPACGGVGNDVDPTRRAVAE
jgi:hypothetical protein